MIHYMTSNGIGNAWVAAELKVLSSKDVPFVLHSMRPPHQNFFASDWATKLNQETKLLYPLPLWNSMVSLVFAPFLYKGKFWMALADALFGERESFRVRTAGLFHLYAACHWARGLRREQVSLVHSQWIQSGGTIAMYGAWLIGAPFSFTGHAVDLFRERAALKSKIRRADHIVCISEFHRDFYMKHGARPEQLLVAYCGIELEDYEFRPKSLNGKTPHIISLGRLIEKKGFEYLIDACALLRERGVDFSCTIGGDGPLEDSLKARVKERKLEDIVDVTGKKVLQEDLAAFMHAGDIFAQPCVWSHDNDVDGIPRTLMEAMACGLPSISTRIAGIPDLVRHEETGLLVEPRDTEALANGLERLIKAPSLAEDLSKRGRNFVEQHFKLPECLDPLIHMFRQELAHS